MSLVGIQLYRRGALLFVELTTILEAHALPRLDKSRHSKEQ
jgi:hypothetical protein